MRKDSSPPENETSNRSPKSDFPIFWNVGPWQIRDGKIYCHDELSSAEMAVRSLNLMIGLFGTMSSIAGEARHEAEQLRAQLTQARPSAPECGADCYPQQSITANNDLAVTRQSATIATEPSTQ